MKLKLAFIITILFSFHAHAQQKSKPVIKADSSAIIYQSFWGPMKSGFVNAVQVKASAQAPIIVRGNDKLVFEVIGFRISYKFKVAYKDDLSGEMKHVDDLRVGDFSSTNILSTPWFESIRDNAKEGDEIIFSKIIFKSSSGKRMLAPDIRITLR